MVWDTAPKGGRMRGERRGVEGGRKVGRVGRGRDQRLLGRLETIGGCLNRRFGIIGDMPRIRRLLAVGGWIPCAVMRLHLPTTLQEGDRGLPPGHITQQKFIKLVTCVLRVS